MRHLIIYLPKTMPRLNGGLKKFNLASTLTGARRTFAGSGSAPKALTLQRRASIRPPMAAGAILPPMFFERYRRVNIFTPRMAFSGTPLKRHQRHQRNATAGISPASRDGSLPKDI
jgi:hypothetical protein